jgi:microcystin-dependent protein
MSNPRAWLTPESAPSGEAKCFAVFVPPGDVFEAAVRGALALLDDPKNWEQFGAISPEDTAQYFTAANAQTCARWGQNCMAIGTFFYFLSTDIPDGCLICDGSMVLKEDYPQLWALVGETFGAASEDYFRLPDAETMFIAGAGGGYSIGDTGGQNSVSLTAAQNGPHTHSIHAHLPGVAVTPGELPVSTPDVLGGSTGSSGSGTAHENRPPFLALVPCVVAR